MSIVVKNETWDEIVRSCHRNDFYHSLNYHNLACENGEGEPVLLTWENGKYKIILPLLFRSIEGTEFKDATSVYGYAGPITSHKEIPTDIVILFQDELKEYFQSQKIISVFSRLHPLLNQVYILDGLGNIVEEGKTVSVNLKLPFEEQWKQFRKGMKYDVNKLSKENYQVLEDENLDFLDQFVDLYNESMQRVDADAKYFFSKSYLERFFNSCSYKPKLFFVKDPEDNQIICGAIFVFTRNIIQYHLSGSYTRFLRIGATKLIINRLRIIGTELNYDLLHLGGGFGGSESDSLFNFKAGFSRDRHTFHVWRYIVDPVAYKSICDSMGILEDNGFFPMYRQ
ncbi:MAG: hypothetical protein HeimC2_30320 [Candidatus Heimdallarchaeota archaeon LC_2]|nr:MAG: hypothetical protein HeimC2_30320 [Candidatus Heimdallarchaeota archaeon LC_2]